MQVEPIARHFVRLSDVHVCFDPDLDGLVDEQNSENNEERFFHGNKDGEKRLPISDFPLPINKIWQEGKNRKSAMNRLKIIYLF